MILKELKDREKYNNDIKGLQFVSLNILKYFDAICRKNNIEYWLDGGTLLGAIRHKGFIPWDDDIDVCIKKNDEERLKKILEKELPYYLFCDEIFLQNEEKIYKIKDRYSKGEEGQKTFSGIWIDIFGMTEVNNNNFINFFMQKIYKVIPNSEFNLKEKNFLKEKLKKILKKLGLDKKKIYQKFFEKIISKAKKDSYIYMEGKTWWHLYKKNWIFPLKEAEFEGHKFFIPNNYCKYLESFYGKDYMKLPPESKRVSHVKKIDIFNASNHIKALKWEDREAHYQKYIKEREEI